MTTIYIVEISLNGYRIYSIEVVKETPKQYKLNPDTVQVIRGDTSRWLYVRETIRKDRYHVLASLQDAEAYCLETMRSEAETLAIRLGKKQRAIATLEAEIAKDAP